MIHLASRPSQTVYCARHMHAASRCDQAAPLLAAVRDRGVVTRVVKMPLLFTLPAGAARSQRVLQAGACRSRARGCRLTTRASAGEGQPPPAKLAAALLQLGADLQRAIDREDFGTAAKLRSQIVGMDPAARITDGLQPVKKQLAQAIEQENYEEAARLRDLLLEMLGDKLGHEERLLPSTQPRVPLPVHMQWRHRPGALPEKAQVWPPTSSEKTTNGIKITVTSYYVPRESCPQEKHYTFAYVIRVTNCSRYTVQLRNAYWDIADGMSKSRAVRGAGVEGKAPLLSPGHSFAYTSTCSLPTALGGIEGHFEVVQQHEGQDGWGKPFKAAFSRVAFNIKAPTWGALA